MPPLQARRIHPHDSFFLFSPGQKAAARAAALPVLAALEARAVRLMELLVQHGFGIHVYRGEALRGGRQAGWAGLRGGEQATAREAGAGAASAAC